MDGKLDFENIYVEYNFNISVLFLKLWVQVCLTSRTLCETLNGRGQQHKAAFPHKQITLA